MVALATEPVTTKPRYRYTDANGAHLHELDVGNGYAPLIGTSSVVNVLGKPLAWWASGQALAPLGWLNPRKAKKQERLLSATEGKALVHSLTLEAYSDFLQDCYRAHDTYKKQAATGGTDMHLCLENYVNECIAEHGGEPWPQDKYEHEAVEMFHNWASDNVASFLWSERHCYSHTLWTGGISDCGAVLSDGKVAVIDFKSSKEAYFSQFVQCGGYAYAIEQNGLFNASGDKVGEESNIDTLIVFPFRGDGQPTVRHDAREFKFAFFNAVHLYKQQQKFDV